MNESTTPLISFKTVDADLPEWILPNSMDPGLSRAATEGGNSMSEANSMDPDLYRDATEGGIRAFTKAIQRGPADRDGGGRVQISPQKNTVLHIATSFGHGEIVRHICREWPSLVNEKNSSGDTALHIAARAGNQSLVGPLVNCSGLILGHKNEQGNTTLHEALRCRREVIAHDLILRDQKMSYSVNNKGESLLYLAAKAGYVDLVTLLMKHRMGIDDREARQNKSHAHAAILGRDIVVLKQLWENNQSYFNRRNEEGTNPLRCAASTGFVEGVNYILSKFYVAAYRRDNNGFYPIHVASSKGHINVIQEMLRRRPEARELLNQRGQNILHAAGKSGKDTAFSYMLKMPELEKLINKRDGDGNTSLHLATIHGHPKIVRDMTWDERVHLNLENYEGRTALDIAKDYISKGIFFTK